MGLHGVLGFLGNGSLGRPGGLWRSLAPLPRDQNVGNPVKASGCLGMYLPSSGFNDLPF